MLRTTYLRTRDSDYQIRAIRNAVKYLGWTASSMCYTPHLRDRHDKRVSTPQENLARLTDEAYRLREAAGPKGFTRHFRTPLAHQLEVRKWTRRLKHAAGVYPDQITESARKWELDVPSSDLYPGGRCYRRLSTHRAWVITSYARYRLWESLWPTLTEEAKHGRIRNFAHRLDFWAVSTINAEDGIRRWNFWDKHSRRKVHPLTIQRATGLNPHHEGLPTEDVRLLMVKTSAGWGGYGPHDEDMPLHRLQGWEFWQGGEPLPITRHHPLYTAS